jgi:hypothetical protein
MPPSLSPRRPTMPRKPIPLLLAIATALLSGCASELMIDVKEPRLAVADPANSATLVILRSSTIAVVAQANVFDISSGEPRFIGVISAGKKIAYTAPANKVLRFAVGIYNTSFLDAKFDAGKAYYARVRPRFFGGFTFVPMAGDDPTLDSELECCNWVANTPASEQWARDNMAILKKTLVTAIPSWKQRKKKRTLEPSQGR